MDLNFNVDLFSVLEQNLSEIVGLDGWKLDEPPKYLTTYSFENFDHSYWLKFSLGTRKLPFYVGAIYIAVIFTLQKYMKNRPPMDLRIPLFFWNLSLGIFSIIGFSRMLPAFASVLLDENGFFKSICVREGGDHPTAFWYIAFGLSKYIELGDTMFIILRKKPLVALQWYHHLATMITQWLLGPLLEPISRWYVVMNYGVHSFMYIYFALKAINISIPKQVARFITTMQLLQMIAGLLFNILTIILINNGIECSRHPFSIKVFVLLYGSFTVLFGKLFYDNVIASKDITKKMN